MRLTLCCCCCCCFEGRSLADFGFLLAWAAGNEDVAEGDNSVAPFWNNSVFEDDFDAGGLGEIVSDPSGERFYAVLAQSSTRKWELGLP